MQILNTASSSPSSALDRLALYSALDVLSLFEIKSGLLSLMDPGRLTTYEFEMELQSALLDLSFNGIPVDEGARRELITVLSKEQLELTTLLNRLLEEIGYFDYYRTMVIAEFADALNPTSLLAASLPSRIPSTWDEWKDLPLSIRREFKTQSPAALATFQKSLKSLDEPFNPNSPAQKLQLFYHFFGSPANTVAQDFFFTPPWLKTYGIPEYKSRNTKNEYTPAADRAALEKIVKASDSGPAYAAFWAAPFAHICITLADLAKSLGFLSCKLEHGIFKASFGAVTDTGRLSSRQNAQGYGSNAQNVTPKLRHIFVAPPKEIFCAGDYSQIESRNVAAICYQLFGLKNYIAATESGDLHSLAASMVWSELPWPEDFTIDWTIKHGPFPKDMIKAAKAIASVEFYRGKSRRDVSKTLGHGTSYMGRPPQMSKHSHIDVKLIEHYQDVFFGMFPEVKMWHRWVVEQVQTKGEITTFLGRTRRFFGRPNDDATIRKAVAYEPQSVAADYCNRALLRLHRLALAGDFPATIRLSKHDELVVTYEESLEEQVIAMMVAQMEEHLTLTSPSGETRDWFVPVEIESGWNMGRKSEANPNGLSHPLDGRTRIDLSSWKVWKM